jgi:hypothetical protein
LRDNEGEGGEVVNRREEKENKKLKIEEKECGKESGLELEEKGKVKMERKVVKRAKKEMEAKRERKRKEERNDSDVAKEKDWGKDGEEERRIE